MTGPFLLLAFIVAIAVMILLISKLRVHPFLAILAVSLLLAFVAGIPMGKIPGVIGSGFAGTFTSIGIIIILGAFIGAVLEKTGAAFTLADLVIRLLERKRPELAIELMGWVVTSFGGISAQNGYRTQTLMTLVIGLAAMAEVFLLSLLF